MLQIKDFKRRVGTWVEHWAPFFTKHAITCCAHHRSFDARLTDELGDQLAYRGLAIGACHRDDSRQLGGMLLLQTGLNQRT